MRMDQLRAWTMLTAALVVVQNYVATFCAAFLGPRQALLPGVVGMLAMVGLSAMVLVVLAGCSSPSSPLDAGTEPGEQTAGEGSVRPGQGDGDGGVACVPGGQPDEEFSLPACGEDGPAVGVGVDVGAGGCDEVVPCEVGALSANLEWSMPTFPGGNAEVSMQPIVTSLTDDNGDGRVDGDDVPDIVLVGNGDDVYVHAISGDGSGVHFSQRQRDMSFVGGLAAGDIDGDGMVELLGSLGDGIICLSHTGSEQWRVEDLAAVIESSCTPAIADMDGDGAPEVSCGRIILNGDGSVRHNLGAGPYGRKTSVPADVDLDGEMELVLGNGVYRLDGTALWEREERGGYVAVANFDDDDLAEMVVVGDGAVRVLNAEDGTLVWSTAHGDGGDFDGGPPVVADLDGDGAPEVGVQHRTTYTAFDTDGSALWIAPIEDNSAFTGSVGFDFDGDGSVEIVQADTQKIRILSGVDGSVRFEADRGSSTAKQSATVADVDGDGSAEIVVPWDYFQSPRHGVDVYGHFDWAGAPEHWNQYDYTITNVESDGTIPTTLPLPWLEHNTYRTASNNRAAAAGCKCRAE